ncbi:MAG TPA: DUF4252 domain-containing protein [Pyrinomonadaceae bacterium]|nr:DUF4252 domain-containing protein [Pyrinomonadaceae bacterium]
MKLLFQKLLFAVLISAPIVAAQAQDSRIQTASLDHLAAKASQTFDVNMDERLIKLAAAVFSDDGDEKKVKELLVGIKGIYVKHFEFENDGQYTPADIESIRTQLRTPSWSRLANFTSKKDGNLEVYLLMTGEKVGGLAVLSSNERELTIVNIVGSVDLEKLAQLEGQFGVPELGIQPGKAKPKNEQ